MVVVEGEVLSDQFIEQQVLSTQLRFSTTLQLHNILHYYCSLPGTECPWALKHMHCNSQF